MHTPHSWNWLAPRRSLQEMFKASPAVAARPCLPAIEPLGDRVMLSTTIGPGGDGSASADQILIGLLKSSIGKPDSSVSLLNDQLDALKIAGSLGGTVKIEEYHALTDSFLKIQNVLFKFSDALISDQIGDIKYKIFSAGLDSEFFKVNALAHKLGGDEENALVPAVQKVVDSASKLFSDLTALGPALKVDLKIQDVYLKLSGEFLNFGSGIVKIGEDVFFKTAANKGTQEYLKITLEDILVSSARVQDEGLKVLLDEITGIAVNTLDTLLEPPPIFEGPFLESVVVLDSVIDDIITP